MEPDLQSSLICDDVRQERNGKFILIGLFDGIAVPQLPVHFPKIFIVNRWCSGEGEFQQQCRIIMPDQISTFIEGKKIPVKLQHENAVATNVEIFLNVQFKEPGTYWVETSIDGHLKLRYPLQVKLVNRPSGPEHPPQNPPG